MIRCFIFGHSADIIREEWREPDHGTGYMPMHVQFSRCRRCGIVEARITSPFQDLCALGEATWSSSQQVDNYWGDREVPVAQG